MRDKSVDGLVAALVADEKKELEAAVSAGRITAAEETQALADAKQRFTDLVSGKAPPWFRGGHGPAFGRDRLRGGFAPPAAAPML